MLVVRRTFCFIINFTIAITLLLIVEVIVAYFKHLFSIYSPPFYVSQNQISSRAYMIVLPLIIALFDSRFLGNGFIGGYLSGSRTITHNNYELSFIGCYLRTCLFFLPALLYYNLFDPFKHSEKIVTISFFTSHSLDVAFLFLILFIPVSIIINNGYQGIHDIIFGIAFQIKRKNIKVNINLIRTAILTSVLTIVVSIIVYIFIVNSDYYKKYNYYKNILAENLPDLYSWQKQQEKRMMRANKLIGYLETKLKKNDATKDLVLGINSQVEVDNGKLFTIIDISTKADLAVENDIYELAYTAAVNLHIYEQDLESYKIKLSKRYLFDIVAYERAVLFFIRKKAGFVQVSIDRDTFSFGRSLPIGFPDSLLYLTGS